MKLKNNFFIDKDNNSIDFKTKHKYQKFEAYLEKRKKECEKNLSKFC